MSVRYVIATVSADLATHIVDSERQQIRRAYSQCICTEKDAEAGSSFSRKVPGNIISLEHLYTAGAS